MAQKASSTKRKQAYQAPDLRSLTPIERIDFPFGRAYAPQLEWLQDTIKTQEWTKENRKHLPSVTTIQKLKSKGIGFEKWLCSYPSYDDAIRYANKAAKEGTQIHICGSWLAEGLDIDLEQPYFDPETEEVRPWNGPMIKFMESFQQFYMDHQFIVEGSEIPLFDFREDFTGTLDMIGRIRREPDLSKRQAQCTELKEGDVGRILLDVKTLRNASTLDNKFRSHKYQVTAYRMLWENLFPDHPVDHTGILYIMNSWRGEPKYKLKIINEDLESEWRMWVQLWHRDNGPIKPVYAPPRPTMIRSVFKKKGDLMVTDQKLKEKAMRQEPKTKEKEAA